MPTAPSPEHLTLGLTLDRDFSCGEDGGATECEPADITQPPEAGG